MKKQKSKFRLDKEKIYNVILHNKFGVSNGIFYNAKDDNYFSQRTTIGQKTLDETNTVEKYWGSRSINILAPVIDKDNTVPVFTPEGKFISPDCIYLTQAGAKCYAEKVGIKNILKIN